MKTVIHKTILIGLLLVITCGISDAQTTKAKFEPPDGKTIFVIGQNTYPSIWEYNQIVSPWLPAGFAEYTAITNLVNTVSPTYENSGKIIRWIQPLADFYPDTVLQIAVWMENRQFPDPRNPGNNAPLYDLILAGFYDTQIDTLGHWLDSLKRPIFLRLGYEFDNPYFANWPHWQYRQVYRYIVDRMRQNRHDKNISFVWHSLAWDVSIPSGSWNGLWEWYPGDNYVDWIAISYFNAKGFYDTTYNVYRDCERAREYIAQGAKTLGKPLAIVESSPMEHDMDNPLLNPYWRTQGQYEDQYSSYGEYAWNDWFKPYFDYIERHDVKLISYISVDWEDDPRSANQTPAWGDSRVYLEPLHVWPNWQSKLNETRYLHSSSTLYNTLGFK